VVSTGRCIAFCYANTGRLTEALHHLSKVIPGEEDWTEAAIVANYGLIAFREGAPQVGRRFYEEAVKIAEPLSDKRTKIAALIHWSAEEVGLPDSNSERLYEEATQAIGTLFAPDLETRLKRLRERIDTAKP
jgi:tetratricopeptide (TPR) repeat protein